MSAPVLRITDELAPLRLQQSKHCTLKAVILYVPCEGQQLHVRCELVQKYVIVWLYSGSGVDTAQRLLCRRPGLPVTTCVPVAGTSPLISVSSSMSCSCDHTKQHTGVSCCHEQPDGCIVRHSQQTAPLHKNTKQQTGTYNNIRERESGSRPV